MSSLNLGFRAYICLWIRKAAVVLGAALSVFLICLPLFSQGSYGRILGSVTDQSGGVIAGASAVNANNALGAAGLGNPGVTPDIAAGNPLIGSGSQRVMQLGLKLTF